MATPGHCWIPTPMHAPHENRVKNVDNLCRLFFFMFNDRIFEKEIKPRIEKAVTTFSRLSSRAWHNPNLTLQT